MRLIPKGNPIPLKEVEYGSLFQYNGCIALMTEYGTCEAIIVGSGEFFWGGVATKSERQILIVQPLEMVKE